MNKILLIVSLFLVANTVDAQDLPKEARFVNGHFLKTGGSESQGLYDESVLKEIRIYFTQCDYWELLKDNYGTKKNLLAKLVYDGKTLDSIGIRFKGQT